MVRGDIGTAIDCNMRIDLTTATVLQIKYRKPSGASGTWAATLTGTSTLRYITLAGDINEAGPWQFQPYAERPGWSGHGRAQTVEIGDTLD